MSPESPVARSLLSVIRFYQRAVSPALPSSCRFQPTCSQYAYEAIERYGALHGAWLTARRLLRCTPLTAAGYDPVPALPIAAGGGWDVVSRETRAMANLASEEA